MHPLILKSVGNVINWNRNLETIFARMHLNSSRHTIVIEMFKFAPAVLLLED